MLPDFANPERWSQLESGAYTGLLDISEYPPPEYKYFDKFSCLGRAYRCGEISAKDAAKRKKQLLRDYRLESDAAAHAAEDRREWIRALRLSEQARVDIMGSNDITEIAMLACEALALLTGDCMLEIKIKRMTGVEEI